MSISESATTVKIYLPERDWLLARQRRVSFDRNETVTMPDLIRELVRFVQQEEGGA